MDDGEKLTDIVGAVDGAEMEDLGPRLQVDTLILHRPGIAGAGSIYRPRVCPYLWGQGQHGVVTVFWRILFFNQVVGVYR